MDSGIKDVFERLERIDEISASPSQFKQDVIRGIRQLGWERELWDRGHLVKPFEELNARTSHSGAVASVLTGHEGGADTIAGFTVNPEFFEDYGQKMYEYTVAHELGHISQVLEYGEVSNRHSHLFFEEVIDILDQLYGSASKYDRQLEIDILVNDDFMTDPEKYVGETEFPTRTELGSIAGDFSFMWEELFRIVNEMGEIIPEEYIDPGLDYTRVGEDFPSIKLDDSRPREMYMEHDGVKPVINSEDMEVKFRTSDREVVVSRYDLVTGELLDSHDRYWVTADIPESGGRVTVDDKYTETEGTTFDYDPIKAPLTDLRSVVREEYFKWESLRSDLFDLFL